MPNKYIKKKVLKYTEEDINKAVFEVKNNGLSMYAAAKKYKIPSTTLYDKIKSTYSTNVVGRRLAIPLELEIRLADAIKTMEKWGYGLSREEVLKLVEEFVKQNNIITPFTNNKPGKDWFINFKKRHRLSIKKPQPVEYVRKKMTDPFVISDYFKLLEDTLTERNLSERPHLIWNMDETSLSLDPTRTKVVGAINSPCSRTTCGTGKENITVLTTVSAAGQKISPLIVFKGKNVWDQWMATNENYDFELSYAASTKGWMNTEIFYNYMAKILIPALGEERPVLIIYDGHSTHVDANVIELAMKNDLTILKLPPHTSHLLQPLDVAVFKSFKTKWDMKLVEWQRHNIGTKMPKNAFAQTFAQTWQETGPEVIISGFKKAGIHPFNANVIPEEKYDPTALKRYKAANRAENSCLHDALSPKSLKELCVNFLNKESKAAEEIIVKDVFYLNTLSKSDIQTQSFIATSTSTLPKCLQNHQMQSKEPKIKILSDITVTFEELLLEKIRQDKKENTTHTKKKRIAKGAEVITASTSNKNEEEELNKMGIERISRTRTRTIKSKDFKEKRDATKGKNIKKKTISSSSSSSISDLISIYSEMDEDYCDLSNEIWDEPYLNSQLNVETAKIQNIAPNEYSEQKTMQNISHENQITLIEENRNIPNKKTGKGKGIGKKTKTGKENNSSREYDAQKNDKIDIVMEKKQNETQLKNQTEYSDKTNNNYKTELVRDKKEISNKDEYILEEELGKNDEYMISDAVIVRYFNRKKWTYYIGFIVDIIEKNKETYYTVDFLKTSKKPYLTFVRPKKRDRDDVTELSITKKVDLVRSNENNKEFNLTDESNIVYFV